MIRGFGAEHLVEQIQRNREITGRAGEEHPALDRLQRWQRARLHDSYADLRAQPRYEAACRFFLEELYGGREVRERDRQLERISPIMRRFLTNHLLYAIGEALRLQAISLELDLELASLLADADPITQPDYAAAYRQMEAWERREEQIVLIGELGRLLDDTVKKPFVRRLVRMMRRPARAAGYSDLQDFLERGFDAVAKMGQTGDFIRTILDRERRALAAMRSGADWPYEPWIGRGP